MFNQDDKKWLQDTLEVIIDRKLGEKNETLRGDLEQTIDKKNEALRSDLNKVIDRKVVVFKDVMDERILHAEERITRHFDMIYENRILPMIEEHIAVLPGAGKSYDLLEERVKKLEDDYLVLKAGVAARL